MTERGIRVGIRRLLALALAAAMAIPAVAPASPSGPAVIAPAGAGILASDNVALVVTIPDAGGVGGRFVQSDGRTWYFTTGYAGLRIFDATNAELPVLTGALPLPVWENEDVDVSVSRKLALISVDNVISNVGGGMYVVSWANPALPTLEAFLMYPASTPGGKGGPGHIANCIADCARYAYVGGASDGSIYIIDLADPRRPRIETTRVLSSQNPAGRGNGAFTGGTVHDVWSESATRVWTTGSGGTAQLDVTNPLNPVVKVQTTTTDNGRWNQFIHHNSMRLDASTMLVTEEDWLQPLCGETGTEQGGFQTWRIPQLGTGNLIFQDQWITELGTYIDGGAAATVTCSSHWFTFNRSKIVAVGWYDQGVRFLDVSDPSNIVQKGYWIRPSEGLGASAGLFHPQRDDIVYVPDYERGLDILAIANGGAGAPTVTAPIRGEWITPGVTFPARPHPQFGYACLLPVRDATSAGQESAAPAAKIPSSGRRSLSG